MKILFFVHGFPPVAAGGTETYVHALARALRRGGDDLWVVSREADSTKPDFAWRRERVDGIEVVRINNCFRTGREFEDTYRSQAVARLAGRVLDEFRPDVAHLHHLTGLGVDVLDEMRRRGIPVVMTVNDFWMMCQRGQLLDLDLGRCQGPTPGACASCLYTDPASASRRTASMRSALASVEVVLCPSQTVQAHFAAFGVPPEKLRRQEQGIDLTPFGLRPPRSAGALRVAFAGSLMASKAPHLLLEAVAGLPHGSAVVRLAGDYVPYHGDDSYRATLEAAIESIPVERLGVLDRQGVARLLLESDVLVVPSIWLENAPFVIKEAFAAGVPVIASDLGGMAELVRHEVSGLLFEPGNVVALRSTIERLATEPGLVERLRTGLPRVRSITEDAAESRKLYFELVESAGLRSRRRRLGWWPFRGS